MIDERTEELASLYAFDLLVGEDKFSFEDRLARDPSLRTLTSSFRESSTVLTHLAPPLAPPPALRTRLLASVAATSTHAEPATPTTHLLPFTLPSWTAWAAAACLLLSTVFLSSTSLQQSHRLASALTESDLLRLELNLASNDLEAERLLAARQSTLLLEAESLSAQLAADLDFTRSGAISRIAELRAQASVAALRITSLQSLLGDAPSASAIAVWNPFQQQGILTVANLPPLPADKDYQLWVIDPQYPIPVDGGVFSVNPDTGETRFTFTADKPVATVAAFAVSLERKGGVPKAEGPMVLVSNR